MKSLIIHMSRSTARRENVNRLMRDLPSARVLEATDGRDPAQIEHLSVQPGNLHRPRYPFALRPAEIGVFQSHRRAWHWLLESGEDYALIAEDDLAIDPGGLSRALRLVHRHADPDMYIRLPVKLRETPAQVIATEGESRLILPRHIGLQCIAQVVGRGAAQRLLEQTDQIDRPVDTFLQMHWITGQPIHAILPTGNREVAGEIGGSTIQQKTRVSGKLTREIRRAAYRTRLALHPQEP